QALETVRGNLTTLADAPRELAALLDRAAPLEDAARAALLAPGAVELCAAAAEALRRLAEWSAEAFKSTLQSAGEAHGRRGRELYQPVRAALTGRTHGPELPLIAAFLGRDECTWRLRAAPRRAESGHGSGEAP
ncbi:MAG TPA: hypothetical protein VGU27_09155, partial [Candidatus Eisenbacteria bacterium]|nr:hypothetical protein [Candidatus Eisenbacteria bacterium]